MVTRRGSDDTGFQLVELLIVVALLGVTLTGVYAFVFAVSHATAANIDQVSAVQDLGARMESLAKMVSGSRLRYADDHRIVALQQTGADTYRMNDVYVREGSSASGDRGELVWETWATDSAGSAPIGSTHNVWVVSDRNANLYTTPPTALFLYFRDANDLSLMTQADRSTNLDETLAAFVGQLPGGYPTPTIGRVRVHLLSAVVGSAKDESRDITLRLRD